MRLGIDSYALRFQGWDGYAFLDYATRLGLDGVQFSTPSTLGSFDAESLARLRQYADDRGLYIEVGMGSIDRYSSTFRPEEGAAEVQLTAMVRVARTVGAAVVRCFLGSWADRRGSVSLRQHMEECVRVLRAVAPIARDVGVKIAVENHAGDLQARELAEIIERAGPDVVGACLDTGNPVWTLEDPLQTVEVLAPYVQTTHVRDSLVWKSTDGAIVQWVPLGRGNVGIERVIALLRERCPNVAINLEIITELGPRPIKYLRSDFWDAFPTTLAADFVRFVRLVEAGQPVDLGYLTAPVAELHDDELPEKLRLQQLRHFEESVDYARRVLGLGERARERNGKE